MRGNEKDFRWSLRIQKEAGSSEDWEKQDKAKSTVEKKKKAKG